jgi:mono/diheme cytochrome c family protein
VIIMQHMQARANLTRDQARAALAFLLASNRSARTAAGDETAPAPITPDAVDGAMIDRGRAVYSGQGGCAACHGADLDGGPIAPSLVDDAWRNGDGSLASILRVVRTGVEGTAMAAFPGGIGEEQAAQVAAYIWAVVEGRAAP